MARTCLRTLGCVALLGAALVPGAASSRSAGASPPGQPPIYISFLWHMHQPIYYPYDSATQTENLGV